MTRLIDADALIENLEYDVELDTRALDDADLLLGMDRELVQFDKDCKQNVVDILKNAPTVDAEPVKHGKWQVTPVYIKCSECGESFMLIPQNYCPNCGAKMMGETE